jgi:hypothetical protein
MPGYGQTKSIYIMIELKTMVEVYKTTVQTEQEAVQILSKMKAVYPNNRFSFDLEDCDKILRAEGEAIAIEEIELIFDDLYLKVEVLPD